MTVITAMMDTVIAVPMDIEKTDAIPAQRNPIYSAKNSMSTEPLQGRIPIEKAIAALSRHPGIFSSKSGSTACECPQDVQWLGDV